MPQNFQAELEKYRKKLLSLEEKMQGEYDKAVLTLSGGALGITFAFLKDSGKHTPLVSTGWLLAAWICWGVSVATVLWSYFSSVTAMRKARQQLDDKSLYIESPGGWMDKLTAALNVGGGILFLLGVVFIAVFMMKNVE